MRARQSFGQRLIGVGDLTVETAGEAGILTIPNIDDPQAAVEAIIDAEGPAAKPRGERG